MASFFCHTFAVTKQVRLERIVRAQIYRTLVSLTFFFSPRLGRHISIR